jgi:hypothetical protein
MQEPSTHDVQAAENLAGAEHALMAQPSKIIRKMELREALILV